MIRKTLAIALSIPLCALAVACGGGDAMPEAKAPETPETPAAPETPETPEAPAEETPEAPAETPAETPAEPAPEG